MTDDPDKEQFLKSILKKGSNSVYPNYWCLKFVVPGKIAPLYAEPMKFCIKTPIEPGKYSLVVETVCRDLGMKTHKLLLEIF